MWSPSMTPSSIIIYPYPLPPSLSYQHLETRCPTFPCPFCYYDPSAHPTTILPPPNTTSYLNQEKHMKKMPQKKTKKKGNEEGTRKRCSPAPPNPSLPKPRHTQHARAPQEFWRKKEKKELTPLNHCKLCRSNKETEKVFMSHVLRDPQGKVVCPVLRTLVCGICGKTGDEAHTQKYCPLNLNVPTRLRSYNHQESPYFAGQEEGTPTKPNRYRLVRNAVGGFRSLKY